MKADDVTLQAEFDRLVGQIRGRKAASGECPRCGLALDVTLAEFMTDIRCPNQCFEFHLHGCPNRMGRIILRLKRLLGFRLGT